jgi:hypothetical protein
MAGIVVRRTASLHSPNDKLMALEIEPVAQVYDTKDCMLYALGVGLGH